MIWPFAPVGEFSEELAWSTQVLGAREDEQRIALRPVPRRSLSYGGLFARVSDARLSALPREAEALTMLRTLGASDLELPVWPEALAAAVAQWEEVARIERLALEAGSGVQRDLLTAEAGLFQARAGYARARYDTVLAHVRIAKATGRLDMTWIDERLEILR